MALIVRNEVVCAGSVVKEPRVCAANNPVPDKRSSINDRILNYLDQSIAKNWLKVKDWWLR